MAGHARDSKVLNATEDLDAALVQSVAELVQSVAELVQNVAELVQNVAVPARTVAVPVQSVAEPPERARRIVCAPGIVAGVFCSGAGSEREEMVYVRAGIRTGAGGSVRSGGSRPIARGDPITAVVPFGACRPPFRSGRSVLSGRAGRSVEGSISVSVGLVGAVGGRRSRGADSIVSGVSEFTGRSPCGLVRAGRAGRSALLSFASRPPVV